MSKSVEEWSEGIYLLGTYSRLRTGCWLLAHRGEAAILEMPPYEVGEADPVANCMKAVGREKLSVKYLLASHAHWDHLSPRTIWRFMNVFPDAVLWVHRDFECFAYLDRLPRVHYFKDMLTLYLGREILYLIHAPKHSLTDTMVIFRGVIFTGDWELNTILSVNDSKWDAVPLEKKLSSIDRMSRFEEECNYRIVKVFSTHANDRRENVDFTYMMEDTRKERKFW